MADEVEDMSGSCSHLSSLMQEDDASIFLSKYKSVIAWSSQRFRDRHRAKRRKILSPSCDICRMALPRPFVCLHCSFSGCWHHFDHHLVESDHPFCVDSKSGAIYCRDCSDFVFEAATYETYSSATLGYEEKNTTFRVSRLSRQPYSPWVSTEKDADAAEGSAGLSCQGRRGLLNLGQTCYLNAILQSFLANPLLRSFFLSDKHNHKLCAKGKDCTCCEMDKLFSEVYSGNESSPIGPLSFLSTTWRTSTELASLGQHDAHEFFISTLNQIHATSRGSTRLACICIVHSTFDGLLQSDVKCEHCGNVTTTTDPVLDISLELKGKHGDIGHEHNLISCLRRFTQPEKLDTSEYTCGKCEKASRPTKRLSIRKLPPVLSFQFKRFEQKTLDPSTAHKIEAPVRFPASLDMAEFTTLALKERGKGDGTPVPGPMGLYEYDLFCVVCHQGHIDNGHYTCYSRYQDEWYHFDDDKITPSTLGACLKSQAYMCFYVKRHLDYKPYMTPSYIKAREAEAAKEKEREREKEVARIKEAEKAEKELEDALLATV